MGGSFADLTITPVGAATTRIMLTATGTWSPPKDVTIGIAACETERDDIVNPIRNMIFRVPSWVPRVLPLGSWRSRKTRGLPPGSGECSVSSGRTGMMEWLLVTARHLKLSQNRQFFHLLFWLVIYCFPFQQDSSRLVAWCFLSSWDEAIRQACTPWFPKFPQVRCKNKQRWLGMGSPLRGCAFNYKRIYTYIYIAIYNHI
jgi:hypothetical protein